MMKLHCPGCNRATIELTDAEQSEILASLHGACDSRRIECPECHQYQWELAARDLVVAAGRKE